ncbi:MAG: glycosyltransferase family 2 protein [Candidatus Eisenbacteria bacterium]|nr:glycosyltransferase family 2 protein [Candidatus Eisenbacteria bacterium]
MRRSDFRRKAIRMLSVIVPVYNEVRTIREIVRRIREVDVEKELLIVDDFSTDGTREILEKEIATIDGVRVFYHARNRGKGAAIRTAIPEVRGEIALIQDADLEYSPTEYPRLIRPIVEGVADVVYGSRFKGGETRVHLYWHYVGNQLLTTVSNMFTNLNLTDMETCYKVFRADILKGIPLRSDRFGFEPEITAKIARRKCRVYEIPISYYGRDYAEGKKIGWKDAVAAFYCIVRFWIAD